MQWLTYALMTVVFYGFFDFFVKQTSGKVEDGVAGLIINLFATLVLIVYVTLERVRGTEQFVTKEGLMTAVGGGLLVGLATITFIKMFSTGANLSLGVAIVRVGMVVLGVTLGAVVLKEPLSIPQLLGIGLAAGGLGLVLVG